VVGIDLSGRTALVTGGGRGLGQEISLLLAAAGADVIVNYLRHEKPALETVDAVTRLGCDAVAVQADVSHPEDVDRLLGLAEQRYGGIHIFVSNAALTSFRELPDFRRRQLVRSFEIGSLPLLEISSRLFPFFAAEGYGRIVAISSLGGRRVGPGYAAMAATKGALESLMRYVAAYVAEQFVDVTANAVVPSGFHGGEVELLQYEPLARYMAEQEKRTPGGRCPTRAEVASVVCFLASPLGAAVNGQSIVVDRGWSIT
jgi:enoyl-[acyl-carrier protein] reductase III